MAVFIPFATAFRGAAMELVKDYADDVDLKLHSYRARPRSIEPLPCYFIDRVRESIDYSSASYLRRRTMTAEILILWGLFDSGDAVDQRDRFVDGFLDWVTDNPAQADANSTLEIVAIADDPTYIPEWIPANAQKTYFATRVSLEGFVGG